MTTSVLLAHYNHNDDAQQALFALQQEGHRRSVLIHRVESESPRVTHPARRNQRLWRVIGGLGLGGGLAAIAFLLERSVFGLGSPWLELVSASLGFWLGVLLGWLYSRRATPRVDLGLIDQHSALLAPDENLILIQSDLSRLRQAYNVLREIGETEPAVFVKLPERKLSPESATDAIVALPLTQIKEHAARLAQEHIVEGHAVDESLLRRLDTMRKEIHTICGDLSETARMERGMGATVEWILDNEYIVESHVRDVQVNLTRHFYRELPGLHSGPHRGKPRLYSMARELIRHTDYRLDRTNISAFIQSYQGSRVLTIGELWAFPMLLRIGLVEGIHKLATRALEEVRQREEADYWAYRLLTSSRREPTQLFAILAQLAEEQETPTSYFGAQLTGHLYDEETALVPVQSWLERAMRRPIREMQQREQTRQAAAQLSIGNAITSLRQLSLLDWRELFERNSRVEAVLKQDPAGIYPQMDFETRNDYRETVEMLARGSQSDEVATAEHVVRLARQGMRQHGPGDRRAHLGTYLQAEGREELIQELGCRLPLTARLRGWAYRHHAALYLSSIAILTSTIVLLAWLAGLRGTPAATQIFTTLLVALPASQIAVELTNYFVTRLLPPRKLPKLDFEASGIPDAFRTLVTVPVLLGDERSILEDVESLEIRYLANPDRNLAFSLFVDFQDAPVQSLDEDEDALRFAKEQVQALNQRHAEGRFLLFQRGRVWAESERAYLGWERKRGKLEELNRLISGLEPLSPGPMVVVGDRHRLPDFRFVITLDRDTQLPRDSARRMVETMAHPLNRPVMSEDELVVERGYGVIQPRVTTSLPSATASPFSRLFTNPVGVDPYTKAVSDAYMDLSGEGSYHGKGIYDPRVFQRVLGGRFPEQHLLSHDLIEGAYVRVGLATDIELFDEFPERYLTYVRRDHRWVRGDWQILEWAFPTVPMGEGGRERNPLTILNRWKIFDNLRRSLVTPASLLLLGSSWFLNPALAGIAAALTAAVLLFQPLAMPLTWATTRQGFRSISFSQVQREILRAASKASLLPYESGLTVDAIVRVLYRKLVSRRGLLQWTTSQVTGVTTRAQLPFLLGNLTLVTLLSVVAGGLIYVQSVSLLPAALPWLVLWGISPYVGWRLNRLGPLAEPERLPAEETQYLRTLARTIWRYFDDFVGEGTAWLPPDNYQVSHQDQIALRTSPTNIGMWMLALIAAGDFGYLPMDGTLDRLEKTMATLRSLERFRGHLYNWYALPDLEPLEPRYVSFVDSGNLVGSLWTLRQALLEMPEQPLLGDNAFDGVRDHLDLLIQSLGGDGDRQSREKAQALIDRCDDLPPGLHQRLELLHEMNAQATELRIAQGHPASYWQEQLQRCLAGWANWADSILISSAGTESAGNTRRWAQPAVGSSPAGNDEAVSPTLRQLAAGEDSLSSALEGSVASPPGAEAKTRQATASQDVAREVLDRIERLSEEVEELASEVDLRFLYDPRRRLFAIGYNVSEHRRDGAYYDMLASEARLGSFVSIARGEVPVQHWLSMSRPYGSRGRARVLMSWTGTMFEYLMPHLFQRTFPNSLLEKATHEAIELQIDYAASRGVPWGISESAFGDLDLNRTYQYRAFGIPWLGLKRGLEEDLVVAPYATLLALPFRPSGAVDNLRNLEASGLRGEYGFFEAIDYSRRDREKREQGVIVRAYMAHHQGMGFLALANQVLEGIMQRRFHLDRRVMAAEPLLFERVPVSPVLHHLPTREELPSPKDVVAAEPSVSSFTTPHTITPRIQLLSNGRYHALVTAAGGGYCRWRGKDITRFRADTTRDSWGSFLYVRDIDSDEIWSNAYQPVAGEVSAYEARFPLDRAEFSRRDKGVQTDTEIIVSPEDDVEIRRVTFTNRSLRMRYLEVTSFLELAMAEHNSDRQHPAFNKLFIGTEATDGGQILVASRRMRSEDEEPIYVAHRLTFVGSTDSATSYETDRRVFIGRGRTLRNPAGLARELGNTAGYVLDPILSLRGSIRIPAGQEREVSMITAVGESREVVLRLMEKFADPAAIGRAFELSWASTQLSLRMMRIHPDEARRFQKLASYMIYPSGVLRPPEVRIRENRKGQSALWPYAISGDNPIALVSIGEAQDLPLVRQLLQAHGYWRRHGLVADLVILNEESSSYEQPLKERLERLIQALAPHARIGEPGGVYLLSADQIPEEDIDLLLAAARVSLVAARGPLAQQLGTPSEFPEWPEELEERQAEEEPSAPLPYLELPYFNSLGGFTPDGSEYVVYMGPDTHTPAPWVNVISNPSFGTMISEAGASFTWYGNSQRNRLTAWSNDPVIDPTPEAIFLRDEASGVVWSPTPQPMRSQQAYRAHHGAGYSHFEHNRHGIEAQLTHFVPVDDEGGDPLKVGLLRLRNDSERARELSVTYYVEWTLGEAREESQQHVITEWDEDAGLLLARNYYHRDYPNRVAFLGISPRAVQHSGDRTEFLGRNGSAEEPQAMRRKGLSGRVGGGYDPCGAVQTRLELAPGEEKSVVLILGQADDGAGALQLFARYRERLASETALASTRDWWDKLLSTIQVETPELSVNFMLNRWLLYQSLSCRMWGRSAFYQSGGAFGFRDQLQDALAMIHAMPDLAREQILIAAGRQFAAGDVQHWWHPPGGEGVRTRISDDLLWLPFATEQYVKATGDLGILNERIPFLQGRDLEQGEHEIMLSPMVSGETATLFEHCQRAIAKGLTAGPHGLPLMGAGDWNDGMNRVGIEGRGESVWLAWFLIRVLKGMAELASLQGMGEVRQSYEEKAMHLIEAIQKEAWDGAWYLRAFFDNGEALGSSSSEEGWIDSLPQSWAWIADGGNPERATQALESAWRHLVRVDDRLVLLFTPPFDRIEPSPGYIQGYPPGVRENGGQYTHAALWLAIAFARSGDGDRAAEILRLLNPIEHAKDVYGVWRYAVEPYAVAADVYRLSGRIGHGGWTWYTGSAAWMYRAWTEEILGIKLRGDVLEIDPVIPQWWEGFSLRYRKGKAIYWIEVINPDGVSQGVVSVQIDGRTLPDNRIPLESKSVKHRVQVRMGMPGPNS